MNKASLLIATLLIGSLALHGEAAVAGAKVPAAKTNVPSLAGGTVSDDMLDVTMLPLLALPPTAGTENQSGTVSSPVGAKGGVQINATTGAQCATPTGPLPAPGWTLTAAANVPTCSYPYTSGFYSVCFGPNRYCFNQVSYTSFHDLPVGRTLRFCSVIGVPNGWSVIQVGLPSSCPNSGEDWVMQHVACVAGDTNCYPQSASITASPQTVTVPYGQSGGSTTINWNTLNYSNPCLWVQNSGGSPGLWSCAGTGAHSQVWPYVPSGGTSRVWISNGGNSSPSPELAQVTVTGVAGVAPRISASPQTVQIPQGSTSGSTTISYDLTGSGYTAMCMWQSTNGEAPRVWHCEGGSRYSAVWPYVPLNGNTRIWLTPNSTSSTPVLASVTVTGVSPQQTATISASPQVVTVPQGQATGSTTISWNTVNYSNPCLWVQNSEDASPSLWSCAGAGAHSQLWPYVPAGGTSKIWISNGGSSSPSPNVAQVVVTGVR